MVGNRLDLLKSLKSTLIVFTSGYWRYGTYFTSNISIKLIVIRFKTKTYIETIFNIVI
jgi:hypothetical protein